MTSRVRKQSGTRLRLFQISARSLFKHNILAWVVILALGLIASLPNILYTTVDNYLDASERQKKLTYGAFTDIYYEDSPLRETAEQFWRDRTVLARKLPGFQYEQRGEMFAVARVILRSERKEKDQADVERAADGFYLGYADENFRQLAELSLLEGQWPSRIDEVVLTEDIIRRINPQLKPGDQIQLGKQNWTLAGITRSYGLLWVKDVMQSNKGIEVIKAFVARESAERIFTSGEASENPFRIFLFDRGAQDNRSISFNPESRFFYNHGLEIKSETDMVRIPDSYAYGLYSAILAISFIVLWMFNLRRNDFFRRLAYLGMSRGQQLGLSGYDSLLILLAITSAGSVFSVVLSWLAHLIMAQAGGFDYAFTLRLQLLLKRGGYSLLLIALALILSRLIVQRDLYRQAVDTRKRKARRPRSHRGILRLAIWDMKQHRASWLMLLLTFSLCGALMVNNYRFNNRFVANNPLSRQQGLIPQIYDYELLVDGNKINPGLMTDDQTIVVVQQQSDEEPLYYYFGLNNFGITREQVNALQEIEGIKELKAYRELFTSYVELIRPFDDYLDQQDGRADGEYFEWTTAERLFDYYDLKGTMVNIDLTAYPISDIEAMSGLVSDGSINLEKLRSGEEVVLIAPTFKLVSLENTGPDGQTSRGWSLKPVPDDEEGAVRLETIRVGDLINLHTLSTDLRYLGQISADTLKKDFTMETRQVRVGAIIRQEAGKFAKGLAAPRAFKVVTTNDALDALKIPARYTRVNLFSEQKADFNGIRAQIERLMVNLPVMSLDDLHMQLTSYHSYGLFLRFFLTLLNGLMTVVAFVMLLSQLITRVTLHRKRYALLRLNGLTLPKLALIWLLQYGFALLLVVMLYRVAVFVFQRLAIQQTLDHGQPIEWARQIPFHTQPWLLLAAIIVVSLVLLIRRLYRQGLRVE